MEEDSRCRLRPKVEAEVDGKALPPELGDQGPAAKVPRIARAKKAMTRMAFDEAAAYAFEEVASVKHSSMKRQLCLNALGGLAEISDPSSLYRKSLEARGSLLFLWLVLAIVFCAINATMLIVPNAIEVRDALALLRVSTSKRTGHIVMSDLALAAALGMAWYELFGTGVIVMMILCSWRVAVSSDGFHKWNHITLLAWYRIPHLARFSAIKSLGRVHPKIVLSDLQDVMEMHSIHVDLQARSLHVKPTRTCLRATLHGGCLVFRKLLVLAGGVVSLIVKVQQMSRVLSHAADTWWMPCYQVSTVVAFLNQCLNIVDVNSLLKQEALRFAFSGEDGIYQKRELIYAAVFRAGVAQGLWESVGKLQGRHIAFAALFSFSNKDVQRLALGHSWHERIDGRLQPDVAQTRVMPLGVVGEGDLVAVPSSP